MRLFGKKKSNTAIREEPPQQQPAISRPRAQGHLPPTTGPKPPTLTRRSFSSNTPTTGEVTTPLYARFARADSFENLSLRAKPGADSRAPSYAPTQQELEDDAQRLGYDRPWAKELLSSFDSPEPTPTRSSFREPAPTREPVQPTPTGSSIRVVSNPSSPPDRKSSVDKRVSLDAVAAADPFMASKMQSIMRRAPSNVRGVDSTPTTPKRSVTAPPNGIAAASSPPPRVPTAPPTRSVSTKGLPTPPAKSPPVSSRPSFDDDDSTFSHSHTGHQPSRPAYPSAGANVAKRERGPPPVAGTPSAYAWRSGQSDDGHGGSSNFYTGGSQTSTTTGLNSFFPGGLPPGAAPPDPSAQRNPNNPSAGLGMGPNPNSNAGPVPMKKRTPSNPPVNRTPAPAGHGRRMSVDGSGSNARPLSGGPGTWGGSAIPGRPPSSFNGPSPNAASPNNAPPPPPNSYGGPNPNSYGGPNPNTHGGPNPNTYGVPNTTYGDLSRAPTVRSVQPGEIFHHPGTMPPPQVSSAPYQAVSSPPPPVPPVKVQTTRQVSARLVSSSQPQAGQVPQANVAQPPQSQVPQPPQAQPQVTQSPQPQPQPTPTPTRQLTSPPPASTPAQPKKSTPALPPGAAPASPSGYKHSPTSYGPGYSAYGPTPGSAYGSVETNGNVNEGSSRKVQELKAQMEARDTKAQVESRDVKAQVEARDVKAQVEARGVQEIKTQTESREVKGQGSELRASQNSDARATVASPVSDARKSQVSDVRKSVVSDVRKSQASDVRTIQADRRASHVPERASQSTEPRPSQSSDPRPGQLVEPRPSYTSEARPSPTKSQFGEGRSSPAVANQFTASPVGVSPPGDARFAAAESGRATPNGGLVPPGPDARNSTYSGASSVSVVPPSTPIPPASPSKSTVPTPSKSAVPTTPSKPAPRSATASPVRGRELPQRPGPSVHPPSAMSLPPRAPSSMSVSSYGTALPGESEHGSEAPPSKLALGGLAPINTSAPRSGSPTPTTSSAAPTSAMVTARMTPTTTAALSPATIPSLPSSTPQRGLNPPRAVSPTPTTSTTRMEDRSESDAESSHTKKRKLVKTRKIDGANSFRSSDEQSERPTSIVPPQSPGPGPGLNGGEDPFARAPPTIVKATKRVQEPAPKRAMPLSPPLSSDDHDTRTPTGFEQRDDKSPMTPALTDEEERGEVEEPAEPETTTPPGSPPPPKIYPLETHLNMPSLIAALLPHLSFRDWNALNALNAGLRRQLEETRALREEVLEYWLRGVGYARWKAHKREQVTLTLRDLNAYMRGVSIAVYRYSAIAESFLAVRAQQEQTKERVPGAASKGNLVRALASSCRAYTKVILRLREQADFMHPEGDFKSPLFKAGSAPLLRVFVPSKEGAWLSDTSVLDCEKELKRAGALNVLRIGDVVWDAAVGDEGNSGRMVWDGNYLVDLDYTYSTTGELPKYIHSLAFSPSYWHKIIRTSNSPLCHIDLAPYAAEIAANLSLVQDRVQTETPQGGRHTVVRWVHRSRFHTRPGLPIPGASPPALVDRMWDGYIVVEVEGTNEGLADLQSRVGNNVRLFPAKTAGMELSPPTGKSPFRLLRSMSRPGEIWIRAVREKERLM